MSFLEPAAVILLSFRCVTHLYGNNSIQHKASRKAARRSAKGKTFALHKLS